MPGKLIALEGSDGVGKTTLAKLVADIDYGQAVRTLEADTEASGNLAFVSRRQISATSEYSARLMAQLAKMLWHSGDSPDLPDSFWIGIQAAWFTAHRTTVIDPLLEAGFDVIVDGWVFKFFSKLQLQGYDQEQLDVVFGRVRMPDAVVLLTAEPALLFDRRQGRFRPAELGMHARLPDLGRESFIRYQADGQRILRAAALRRGWPTLLIEANETADETADRLAPVIAKLRGTVNLTDGGTG